MSSYRSLVAKFERTKRELGDAENTIRRLTGRDPDEVPAAVPGSGKHRLSSSATIPSRPSFSNKKKPSYTARKRSRERETSYEESSSDEEFPKKKPVIQSTIVAKRHQKRSRKATIEEQNANSKIKARNRRMFSAIVATLEKFKREEKKRQGKESMRAEIEMKVEAATEEERERIKQEKEHLYFTRRAKQTELRCLEKKIERAESHEVFDANHRYLLNYIMTKAKPPIFFLPQSHTSETRKSLEESRSKIEGIITKRKISYETDLSEIEEWYRKDSSLPVDKENKHPKAERDSQDVPETESESLILEKEITGHVSNPISILDSNSDSNSDSNDADNNNNKNGGDGNDEDGNDNEDNEDDSSNTKNVGSLEDEDFEPIYD